MMIKKSISLTPEGKKDLEKELDELIKGRPMIAEKIATARSFGDLSENEEYSSARNEQKVAENRIAEIQEILKNAKVIRGGKKDKVTLGVTVTLTLGGKKMEYTLVGPTEANPLEGKISNESPIGKALMGHKIGDDFEFNGKKTKIIEIK
ncbi:transcription elongation factor GreA [Candidatus Saccharibacteria bacterium]|nr:transcription elongation factor GreA [Candidatus Saccharibacteria bacterium]MBR3322120.1 transcription elongation factor GreA [Candidatus Saccharibacteria bacterium]